MISTEFKDFLKRHKLNYAELAVLLDCSPMATYSWQVGSRNMSPITARFLKVIDVYPGLIDKLYEMPKGRE